MQKTADAQGEPGGQALGDPTPNEPGFWLRVQVGTLRVSQKAEGLFASTSASHGKEG